jgi:hypothetical protein
VDINRTLSSQQVQSLMNELDGATPAKSKTKR